MVEMPFRMLGLGFVALALLMQGCAEPTPPAETVQPEDEADAGASVAAEAANEPPPAPSQPDEPEREMLDPAAWGDDHVGKSFPDYVTGGQCLFCHRDDIGPRWQNDPHRATVNEAPPDSPFMQALRQLEGGESISAEVQYLLGDVHRVRYLKPSGKYGQVAIFTAMLELDEAGEPDGMLNAENPTWDDELFANSCAGCHATAIDQELKAFSGISHDCYVCHGDVPETHAANPKLALFAESREHDPRVVTSICAQCHIRSGESRSTGLPYPNTFVPGDNLFRDFQVDFSDEHLASLDIGDRHVLQNVREVMVYGETETTCVTCHDVHDDSSRKHRVLKRYGMQESCAMCHPSEEDWTQYVTYEDHSELCQY